MRVRRFHPISQSTPSSVLVVTEIAQRDVFRMPPSPALARWANTDAQTKAMLDLTRKLVALTWAVVVLTLIVLAGTLYLGLR
jgi:hypothetical protein